MLTRSLLLMCLFFVCSCRPGGGPDGATAVVTDLNPLGDATPLTDMIRLTNLRPGQAIASPFELRGEAVGGWFTEAQFPVLLSVGGRRLTQSNASAVGEWMTADFVPFTATLNFAAPAGTAAQLTLRLSNMADGDEGKRRAMVVPVILQ